MRKLRFCVSASTKYNYGIDLEEHIFVLFWICFVNNRKTLIKMSVMLKTGVLLVAFMLFSGIVADQWKDKGMLLYFYWIVTL